MGWKRKLAEKVGLRYPSDPPPPPPPPPPSSELPFQHLPRHVRSSGKEERQNRNEHLSVPSIERKHESKNTEHPSKSSVTGFLFSILSSTTPSKCKASSLSIGKLSLQKYSLHDVIVDASASVSWGSRNGNLKPQDQESVECVEGSLGSQIGLEAVPQNLRLERQSSPTVSLALPPMSEKSLLLSETFRACIYSVLPNIVKGRHWIMLYSTAKDGISLRTLYRKSSALSEPFLLVAGDYHGVTFGGLSTAPLQPATKPKYSGTNEMFVFTNVHENPKIFKATGLNRYFILCMNDSISFGGGGSFALRLAEDLLHGSSGVCNTFGNDCLATSTEISIANVEVWGFAHIGRYT